jgi:hypothetical protein
MTNQTVETVDVVGDVLPFFSKETEAAYVSSIVKAVKSHAGADRNLVGSLLTSARSLECVITEDDWTGYLVKIVRKGIAAKVSADSVKVYVSHAKCATIAATGRPEITDALPLGKHWTDQRTSGRKLEGINAYVKRVSALLKVATRNELGHLILPEGYSLMGVPTASPEAETPTTPTTDTVGSAGASSDQEGGLNVDPAKAKADALETAALVLLGNAKAAASFLALIADKEGKAALAKLMEDHAKAAKEAAAKAAADAKAGQVFSKAA